MIDFTDAPLYGERHGHSIVLARVRRTPEGLSKAEVLCSRPRGGEQAVGREAVFDHVRDHGP